MQWYRTISRAASTSSTIILACYQEREFNLNLNYQGGIRVCISMDTYITIVYVYCTDELSCLLLSTMKSALAQSLYQRHSAISSDHPNSNLHSHLHLRFHPHPHSHSQVWHFLQINISYPIINKIGGKHVKSMDIFTHPNPLTSTVPSYLFHVCQ